MSTTLKVVLGIIAGLVIACIALAVGGTALLGWAGYQVARNIATTPQEAETMATEVADFDLPAGYQSQYGVRAMGIQISAYTTSNPSNHLFIAQAGPDSNLDVEDVQRLVRETRSESQDTSVENLEVIREEDITVRGKPAKLVVSEGTNGENQPYRSMNVLFEGKGGPALISISAPTAEWDEEAYNQFIASIH